MGEEVVYKFDLPNGDYHVRLLFAEIYWETDSADRMSIFRIRKSSGTLTSLMMQDMIEL